MTNLRKV